MFCNSPMQLFPVYLENSCTELQLSTSGGTIWFSKWIGYTFFSSLTSSTYHTSPDSANWKHTH